MVSVGEVTIDIDRGGILHCRECSLRLPHQLYRSVVVSNRLVLSLDPDSTGVSEPEFILPDPSRNVAAVTPNCERDWVVDSVSNTVDNFERHYELWAHQGRVITKSRGLDALFRVDPDSGAILDSWTSNEFRFSAQPHQFDGEIMDICEFGSVTVINVDQQTIYGFDSDGQQLWRRDDGRTWLVGENEADPILVNIQGRGPNSKFVLDPETGALTEHLFGPDDVAADVMGESE